MKINFIIYVRYVQKSQIDGLNTFLEDELRYSDLYWRDGMNRLLIKINK